MKKCPFCAEKIQDEATKCRFCGEWLNNANSGAPESTQPKGKSELAPVEDPDLAKAAEADNEVGVAKVCAWIRFGARNADFFLFSCVAGPAVAIIWPSALKSSEAIIGLGVLFAWVFVESFLLAKVGTTPGKWLFNISIKHDSLGKIPFSKALGRSLSVWAGGEGFGIPIISIFTLTKEFRKYVKEGKTTWDRSGGFNVTFRMIDLKRTVLIALLFLCVLGSIAYYSYSIAFPPSIYKSRSPSTPQEKNPDYWVRRYFATSSLSLESPGSFKSSPLQIDDSLREQIIDQESNTYEAPDFLITTNYVYYSGSIEIDLVKAENGAIENMKNAPGISDFEYSSAVVYIADMSGRYLKGSYRHDSEYGRFRQLILSKGPRMWHVAVHYVGNHIDNELAADRVIKSVKVGDSQVRLE